jgi:hypothetical protein
MSWLSYDELMDTFDSIGALSSKGSYHSGALTAHAVRSAPVSRNFIGNVNPLATPANLVSPSTQNDGALANLFGGGSGVISSGGGKPIVSLPPGTVGQLQTPVQLPPQQTQPQTQAQQQDTSTPFDYNQTDTGYSNPYPDMEMASAYDDEMDAAEFADEQDFPDSDF